jgi:YesN/AraC family two-component response regulator
METIRTQLIEMAFIDVEVELMRLVSALRRIVDDWNKIRIEPAHFDASRLSQGIRSVETLEEALLAIEQTATQLSSLSDIDMECRNDARIHAYQEYLVQHIADPNLCVSIVADHFKISVKQMNRIFKSMTGLTASDYLTGIRMERASELLMHSNAKVQDVAQAVGIINTNYFFTLFKKRFGVTPKDFQIANHPRR